jgi:hypothetical protein
MTYFQNQFFTQIIESPKSNWGRVGRSIRIYHKNTGEWIDTYYYDYHKDHPRHWIKRLAEKLAKN